MKIKEEEPPEGGRRRSGRLAKARGGKKNSMNRDEDETSNDQQTPSLSATPSQSNTPNQMTPNQMTPNQVIPNQMTPNQMTPNQMTPTRVASPSIMSPSDQVTNGENANHTNHCPSTLQAPAVGNLAPPVPPPRPIVSIPKETEPVPLFTRIEENVYLFDRKRSRSHKDIRKMVCDCILTKEERQRGFTGCGEDCLNRILMIECGSRCPVGNDCANKRFQKKQYVKCEPFRAGKKGWGLRVLERVEPGTFIMEYVGEVVDPSEFKSRVRKCAKEKKEHHYFMALKSDEIIDATSKGNMTRFINHSCEPTCETQKWTINGELRVGFFAIKTLEPGDEVTFNYQFERYGKKAQLCFCDTPSCQGVIGGSGTSKIAIDGTRFTAEEMEDIKEYDEILEQDKDAFEDLALGAEIEKLCEVGYLKNKRQVMSLARVMLRTEDNDDRMKLLNILDETKEPVFRRLFIDYHGLRLLWSWMVETDNACVKAGILQVLSVLPIPNRTVLVESKILEVVERWATEPDPVLVTLPPSLPLQDKIKDEQVLPVQSKASDETDKEGGSVSDTLGSVSGTLGSVSGTLGSVSDTLGSVSGTLGTDSEIKVKLEGKGESESDQERRETREKTEAKESEAKESEAKESEGKENEAKENEAKETVPMAEDVPVVDDLVGGFQEETSTNVVERAKIKITIISKKEEKKEEPMKQETSDQSSPPPNIAVLARKLLQMWKNLKEAYKIPRLILKNRKDDELAADAFEEAEKTAKNESNHVERKVDQKPKPYAWVLEPMKAKSGFQSMEFSSQQINGQGMDGAPVMEYDGPRESRVVAHRMNFEMELLKEKYEREMEAIRMEAEETKRKLQMIEQQSSLVNFPVSDSNLFDSNLFDSNLLDSNLLDSNSLDHNSLDPVMFSRPPPASSASSSSYPYPSTDPTVDTSYTNYPMDYYPPMVDYDYAMSEDQANQDSNPIHPELHDFPIITVDNLANVVIECTPRNLHTLRSDEEAVVDVDYGVEYVPKKRRKERKESRDPFDPSFPPPGMYFDFGNDQVYYTSCLQSLDGSWEFIAVPSTTLPSSTVPSSTVPSTTLPPVSVQSDSNSLKFEDHFGPLPPNWRRCRDRRTGRSYFYHKRRSETRWRLPEGGRVVTWDSCENEEPKITSDSVVATADSTSCVGATNATNSPATSSTCMNSPPGIFYKPLNGPKNDHVRIKATPDQSSHKKTSGKRKKPNLEKFKGEISEMVKKFLYPYQKDECPVGKIESSGDFKFLCKKFTNEIYAKEVKSGKTDLVVNEVVKKKSKGYVKKYMATRGTVFKINHDSPVSQEGMDHVVASSLMAPNGDEEAVAEEEEVHGEEVNENSTS